jgi:glutamate synthase (NADPH/NADH) small chain
VEFKGDDKGILKEVNCIKMKLGEPDDSGRRRPIPIEGSEEKIKIDTALVAIGQSPNPLIPQTVKNLKIGKWGNIETDEDGRTNIPNIFAGGDIATGAATVILAMGAGKRSARAIDEYLKTKK